MIEALHTGMKANVSIWGEVSESFIVKNGVKQGYVVAPTLFSIFLSAMLDGVAHSAEEMQKIVDAFSDASKKFDLKINIKKT